MWTLPICQFSVVANVHHPTRRLNSARALHDAPKTTLDFRLKTPRLKTPIYTEKLSNSAQNSWDAVCVSRKKAGLLALRSGAKVPNSYALIITLTTYKGYSNATLYRSRKR